MKVLYKYIAKRTPRRRTLIYSSPITLISIGKAFLCTRNKRLYNGTGLNNCSATAFAEGDVGAVRKLEVARGLGVILAARRRVVGRIVVFVVGWWLLFFWREERRRRKCGFGWFGSG